MSSWSGSLYTGNQCVFSSCSRIPNFTQNSWWRHQTNFSLLSMDKNYTESSAMAATWTVVCPWCCPFEFWTSIIKSSPGLSGKLFVPLSTKNDSISLKYNKKKKQEGEKSSYNTWVSPDAGCILTTSSSDELFSLNKQEYVSDDTKKLSVVWISYGQGRQNSIFDQFELQM